MYKYRDDEPEPDPDRYKRLSPEEQSEKGEESEAETVLKDMKSNMQELSKSQDDLAKNIGISKKKSGKSKKSAPEKPQRKAYKSKNIISSSDREARVRPRARPEFVIPKKNKKKVINDDSSSKAGTILMQSRLRHRSRRFPRCCGFRKFLRCPRKSHQRRVRKTSFMTASRRSEKLPRSSQSENGRHQFLQIYTVATSFASKCL